MNEKEIWQTALGELEITLSKAHFTTWLKGTFLFQLKGNTAIIGVHNGFAKEWLENKFNKEILNALKKPLPDLKSFECKITSLNTPPSSPNLLGKKTPKQSFSASEKSVNNTNPSNLNPKYIFDTFVVGNSNRLAHATAQAVAASPGKAYNPLFLYGGVGLGKTHLAQAIGNEVLRKSPKKKIVYVSCERFTNDYVSSISNNKIDEFKKKYRDVDVFLVDDIQFLAGKEGTQEEFFHTFNTLHQSNRQIVITSDRTPKAIPQIQDRLSSRFGAGMVADIQPPNVEMRQAILKSKAEEKNFPIDDDVLIFIAKNIESNIRDLEGAITRVKAHCELNNQPASLDVVSKVLEDIVEAKGKNLSIEKVLKVVANYFKVEADAILSPKRDRSLVGPRQIVMYLLRHEMNMSFPKIGRELNKKDHTTIMYGVEKIEKEVARDEDIRKELTMIKEQLHSS